MIELSGPAEKILKIIKKRGGRIYQPDIETELLKNNDLSVKGIRSYVSLYLNELVVKDLIEKRAVKQVNRIIIKTKK